MTLQAQRYILAAGEGNADLMAMLGGAARDTLPAMQTRPLHMVHLQMTAPDPAFVHCIGDSFGMTPRLTITSHPDGAGGWVWYLGGEIAERQKLPGSCATPSPGWTSAAPAGAASSSTVPSHACPIFSVRTPPTCMPAAHCW